MRLIQHPPLRLRKVDRVLQTLKDQSNEIATGNPDIAMTASASAWAPL